MLAIPIPKGFFPFFRTLAFDPRTQDLKPPEDPPRVDTGQQTLTLILTFSDQDPSNLSKVNVNLSPLDRNQETTLFLRHPTS